MSFKSKKIVNIFTIKYFYFSMNDDLLNRFLRIAEKANNSPKTQVKFQPFVFL